MKKIKWIPFFLAFFLFSCGVENSQGSQSKTPVTITMSAGQVGTELENLQSLIEGFNQKYPHITAQIKDFSGVPQQQLGAIQEYLFAQSPELDVMQIDVIWPGDLAQHLADLKELGFDQDKINQHFPSTVENNTVSGRLVAMPWFLDAGLLYYREDLLKKYGKGVPKTWVELESTAREIQEEERKSGNPYFWGFVWQGGPGEGLTCFALELMVSNGGGLSWGEQKQISLNLPQTRSILDRARSWVGTISPPEVLTYNGAEGPRKFWETGNVLFMRNWPYAYNLGNKEESPVKGLYKVAPLPAGDSGRGASVLGGWQLGVSRYSRHPKEAALLVEYLTSVEIQRTRAVEFGYYPTLRALYQDGTLGTSGNLIFEQLGGVLETTIPRPSTVMAPHYNSFSQIFFTNIFKILSGEVSSSLGLETAEREITQLMNP